MAALSMGMARSEGADVDKPGVARQSGEVVSTGVDEVLTYRPPLERICNYCGGKHVGSCDRRGCRE